MKGEKIYIRFLELSDAQAVLNLNLVNKGFFEGYVSTRSDSFYTLKSREDFIRDSIKQREEDKAYSFGIFEKGTDKLIGNIALTEILRGPLQSCYIGYYLDLDQNGKGYMIEATKLAVRFAFDELNLHRIEAGVMPHNIRSMRVLEKAGFHKEGIAKKNVKINGKWEDHQVLAIISDKN
ncbi:GNAT family N-acetyltransferase [Clostridium bovifaecis]|uniref:GNAT family N-acetyltransferase n=1 Tax=Clostridium bovifaecis TaxID=2184719 RepID=A0A6I6F8T2_9CLOT|nr:GNAT family N-acetyltransferase [Clostridium bovifaecis]